MNGCSGGKDAKNSSAKREKFLINGKVSFANKGDCLAEALLQNETRVFRFSENGGQPAGVGVDRLSSSLCKINRSGAEPNECYVYPEEVSVDPELEVFADKDTGVFNKITAFLQFKKNETVNRRDQNTVVKTRYDLLADQITSDRICPRKGGVISKNYLHTDILVIGSDDGGLIAAAIAVSAGKRVVICRTRDYDSSISAFSKRGSDAEAAFRYLQTAEQCVFLNEAEIFASEKSKINGKNYEFIALRAPKFVSPGNKNKDAELYADVILCSDVIYAVGVKEMPILFPGAHHPNVMTTEKAARLFLSAGKNVSVKKPVFFLNNDYAYEIVNRFLNAGVKQITVYDVRARATNASQDLIEKGVKIFSDCAPQSVSVKKDGSLTVTPMRVSQISDVKEKSTDCDAVFLSGGFRADVADFEPNDLYLHYKKGAVFPDLQNHPDHEKKRRFITGAGAGVPDSQARHRHAVETVKKVLGDFERYPHLRIPDAPLENIVFPVFATEFSKYGNYYEKGALSAGVSLIEAVQPVTPGDEATVKEKKFFHQDCRNATLLLSDQDSLFRYADAYLKYEESDMPLLVAKIMKECKKTPARNRLSEALFAEKTFLLRKTPLNSFYVRERLPLKRLQDGTLVPETFLKDEDRFIQETVIEEMRKKIIESCGVTEQSGRPTYFMYGKDAQFCLRELHIAPPEIGRSVVTVAFAEDLKKECGVLLSRPSEGEFILIGEREDSQDLRDLFARFEKKYNEFAVAEVSEQYTLFTLIGARAKDITRILPDLNQQPVLHEGGFLFYWYQNVPLRIAAVPVWKYEALHLLVPARYAEAVFSRLTDTKLYSVSPFGEDLAKSLCEKNGFTYQGKLFLFKAGSFVAPEMKSGAEVDLQKIDTQKTDSQAPQSARDEKSLISVNA